jgi:hypothetical protein
MMALRGPYVVHQLREGGYLDSTPPRRFRPKYPQRLTMSAIRGPWRPSGAVAGGGIFAVLWQGRSNSFWAPLHDFEPADQLRLIEACRQLDIEAFGSQR